MKKITLLLFLLMGFTVMAQNYSTGTIALTTGMTAKFDTNSTTVTMTLTGPSDRWFAVGLGVSAGFAMSDGDVVAYGTSLTDRNYIGFTAPAIDVSQDWTTTSNTTAGMTRTVVATRSLNTGDVEDYVFSNSANSYSLAWALPGSATTTVSGGHSSRGFAVANQVLSTDSFALAGFKMYPNPAKDIFAIDLPSGVDEVSVVIFDILGKEVLSQQINSLNNKFDTSSLLSGTYIVKILSEDKVYSSNLVIQ